MSNTTEETRIKETSEKLPDDTIIYSFEKAKEYLEKTDRKIFSISDIILLLLYSHSEKPIFGRVSLMKQVFLLIEEILNKNEVQDAKFIPYRFGMYSFTVGNVITNLEYSGYVEQRGRKNSKLEQFRITNKGVEYISETFNSIPEDLQETIKEKRKGWDQLGYDGILRLVYQKYPEYVEESRIKERYRLIEWGRGVG